MQGVTLKFVARLALCTLVSAGLPVQAQEALYERPVEMDAGVPAQPPGGMEMAGDALVGRPLLLATTALGAATFVVALPFSILGRNVQDSAGRLVGGPFRATFARCLGCTRAAQSEFPYQARSYGETYDAF